MSEKRYEALIAIDRLVRFAHQRGLIEETDLHYARNMLLGLMNLSAPISVSPLTDETELGAVESPDELLKPLLDYAAESGMLSDDIGSLRDLLDAKIMGLLMPRPSETIHQFRLKAEQSGLPAATDWFYGLNIASNYIRMDRVRQNVEWSHETSYGRLAITINLSKPEKDPREIALLKTMAPQGASYPLCLLCEQNVGYAGRLDHPARQNLRILPMELNGERWFFQYSPYVYYNEHSILLKGEHDPMQLTNATFARLIDFIDQMPHYFIGSNADLPIVGGSILNHDHFQAGRHTFPMELAKLESEFVDPSLPDVVIGTAAWPMSVVRVQGGDRKQVLTAAARIFESWQGYSDEQAEVLAYTLEEDGTRTPHNTVTPIARRKADGSYELDLVLRNNRTSELHPEGIFHPHRELHHIKKENIGLIEVMGLAILPGRLKTELQAIAALLTGEAEYDQEALMQPNHPLNAHAAWIEELMERFGRRLRLAEAEELLKQAVGDKFLLVLEDAGVFKRTESGRAAFEQFLKATGFIQK